MLNFNDMDFEFEWEDGRGWVVSGWHMKEERDLTQEEIDWFNENEYLDVSASARERLL